MTEQLKTKLSDSRLARWSALLIVSFTMMCGYFVTDVMAPLEDLLTSKQITYYEDGSFCNVSSEQIGRDSVMIVRKFHNNEKKELSFTESFLTYAGDTVSIERKFYTRAYSNKKDTVYVEKLTKENGSMVRQELPEEYRGKTETYSTVTIENQKTPESSLTGLEWSSTGYGFFTGAYGYFNVFLFMLLLGGIILDKMGVRFTGTMSSLLMFGGALIKWWAISPYFPLEGVLFGYTYQVLFACLGFAIFGVGAEITGITVSKVIVKWFTGHELALAMGLQVAMARIGTGIALGFSLPIAKSLGHISQPVMLGAVALCIGVLIYLVYCVMDKKLDTSVANATIASGGEEEKFKLSDIKFIVTNKGFWMITFLCLLFYSGVFPFLKFAVKVMIYKYNVEPSLAGYIPMMLPFGCILLTPLFGSLYDRIGKGATLMIIGSAMLVFVHLCFTLPILPYWWFALILVIVLGIAFSLVPSAMWPSVPKIIPQKQLGSAYSLIFYIQNIGLSMVPLLVGWVIEHFGKTANGGMNYTIPLSIFLCFGLLSVIIAFMLKQEDKKKHYGLEQANIQKEA